MNMVYGYARYSHIESAKGCSEREQFDQITRHHEYKLSQLPLYKPFSDCVDRAVSAFRRPYRQRQAGRFIDSRLKKGDNLIIAYFDRAFRDAADALVLHKEWERRGVVLHVLNLGVDTSTPLGFAAFGLAAIMAQTMSMQLSERMINTNILRRKHDLSVSKYVLPGFKKVRIQNRELGTDDTQVLFDDTQIPLLKRYHEFFHSEMSKHKQEHVLTAERRELLGKPKRPYAFVDAEDRVSHHTIHKAALVWDYVQPYLNAGAHVSHHDCHEFVYQITEPSSYRKRQARRERAGK